MIVSLITRNIGGGRVILVASVVKGLSMGLTTIFVVEATGLSSFQKALIIAVVSASITGLYTVIAALLAVRRANEIHRDVTDVKRALDVSRRKEDDHESAP